MINLLLLVNRWRRARYWRRTLCPHGNYYTAEDQDRHCTVARPWQPCDRCPYPLYGYGKKMK